MITITKDDCTKMRKVVLSDGSVCHLAAWICPSPSGDTIFPVKCSDGRWYSPQGSGVGCSPSIIGFVEVEGTEPPPFKITKDDCDARRRVRLRNGSVSRLAGCSQEKHLAVFDDTGIKRNEFGVCIPGKDSPHDIVRFLLDRENNDPIVPAVKLEEESADSARPPIPPDSITTSYRTKDGAAFTDRQKAEDRARLLLEMESNGIECVGFFIGTPLYIDLSSYPEHEKPAIKRKFKDFFETRSLA